MVQDTILSTLSGSELQRMKLAAYLGKRGKILILDEPTNSLHLQDVQQMIALFGSLMEESGRAIFTGTPKQMLEAEQFVTAPYLKKVLL